ncbi:MAG: hypothetical protein F4W96_03945 [Chloroflexi bacterium]|nr:hypothetical protein [Chloroflexota bacterium]
MLQFITVNTKQKAVDQGVAQHIIARFTQMDGVSQLPHLPEWLGRMVEGGHDDEGLKIAKALNQAEGSPWNTRIQFADEDKRPEHVITQKTLVGRLKNIILNKNHPYANLPLTDDKRIVVLINYWCAVHDVFVGDQLPESGKACPIVYKYSGVYFFLSLLAPMLQVLAQRMDFSTEAFAQVFGEAQEHLESHGMIAMDPEFWKPGNEAARMNRSGLDPLVSEFARAIKLVGSQGVTL